jgi:hypothetical protein
MSELEPTPAELAESERAIIALDAELERLGVNAEEFYAALRSQLPDEFAETEDAEEIVLGIDAPSTLAIAQTLPSGAGIDVFLAALGIGRQPPGPPAP